jgi:YaiO family outer membrane protein
VLSRYHSAPLLARLAAAGVVALSLAPLVAMTPATVSGQSADSVRVRRPASQANWHLQLSNFYSSATDGYGVWQGQDVRLLYSGKRMSPFVNAATQSRPNGRQAAYGAGAYVVLTPWMYSIVGVGVAPAAEAVLFPRVRSDVSLFASVPKLSGVLMSAGFTDLRFEDDRAGGQIVSVGSTVYRGKGIYSGALFFNRDRASGAPSRSWQLGGQWGAQGQYWLGASVGVGNEAYRLLSATPFDARFENRFVTAFASKWITARTGATLRLDYERKVDVFHRRAVQLMYFVDF